MGSDKLFKFSKLGDKSHLKYPNNIQFERDLSPCLFSVANLPHMLDHLYDKWRKEGLVDYLAQGIPTLDDFINISKYHSNQISVTIIFEDLGSEILSNLPFFEHIFVVLSHHLKNLFFSCRT